MGVLVALAVLGAGVLTLGIVLTVRWLDAREWRRQLVAYRLELPSKLTHDQISGWLAAVGAATREHPLVIEIVATRGSIVHFMVMPEFHVRLLLGQARAMLPGLRAELTPGYPADEGMIRAAGELRVTSTSHPLGHERASSAAGALLAALQPLGQGQVIRELAKS